MIYKSIIRSMMELRNQIRCNGTARGCIPEVLPAKLKAMLRLCPVAGEKRRPLLRKLTTSQVTNKLMSSLG